MTKIDYKRKALLYAEEHGILNYNGNGSKMVYYTNYHKCACEKRHTYKVTVDLNTMKEQERKETRFNKNGNYNLKK